MHIFNLNDSPSLIISSKGLLFRHNDINEQMHRHSFDKIKMISILHRHSPENELFVWLHIQTYDQHAPYLVKISSLNQPLEETLDILKDELQGKVKLSLPKNSFLTMLRTLYKGHKITALGFTVLLLGLLGYHKLLPPSLELLQENALQAKLEQSSGFCSSRAKVAYAQTNSENADVNSYCGLFGTWFLQNSREVPLVYLEADFSDLTPSDYLKKSRMYKNEKKYEQALLELENIFYHDKDHLHAHVLEADINYKIGNKDKALGILNALLLSNPNSLDVYSTLGYIHFHEGEYAKAYPALLKSAQIQGIPETYTMLALIEEEMDKKELAIQNYERALYNNEDDNFVLTRLGLLYWSKHAFKKAFVSLKKAYESSSENPELFLNYYEVSLANQDKIPQEAKQKFSTDFKNDRQRLLIYQMLNVIELSIEGKETSEAKEAWIKNFNGEKLDWSFQEIRSWLDQSDLEIERQQEIQTTIGFFIGYQQVYSLQHQGSLPMEVYQ